MSEDLRQIRIDKQERLRAEGVHVRPDRFDRTHTLGEAAALEEGAKDLRLAGRLVLVRTMGKLTFAHLRDVSGSLQISMRKDEIGEEAYDRMRRLFDLGDFVGAEGDLYRTKTGELTLQVRRLVYLGKALRPLPEKWHGLTDLDACYRRRYLDLVMNPETRDRFRLRAAVVRSIRSYLDEHGFEEVETPILQNKASGALARPFVTHHNALDLDVYLRIAPETYLKRLVVGGYDRVYEFARCFRNEGMDPSHLQEFTMLEYYVAYWSYEENMRFTEELLKHVLRETTGGLTIEREGKTIDLGGTWPRATMRQLIVDATGIDFADHETADDLRVAIAAKGIELEDVERVGRGTLIDQLYKKTVRPDLDGPVFLVGHPTDLSPLARRNDEDETIVDRFQLVVTGWEVVNAYSELVDPLDQRARLEEQAELRLEGDEEALEMDEDYLLAMEHGMPPISGWGMGIDRFVALLSGRENLRDTVFFPLMRPADGTVEEETPETSDAAPDEPSGELEADPTEVGLSEDELRERLAALGDALARRRGLRLAAAMRAAAAEADGRADVWAAAGLAKELGADALASAGAHPGLVAAVRGVEDPAARSTRLAVALAACDQAAGLAMAVSKVLPDRNLASVKPSSVRKRMGKKGFAAGIDREAIRGCEALGVPVDRFLQIVVDALKSVSDEG
jgi:lysyl-tRNA synthetase class 2